MLLRRPFWDVGSVMRRRHRRRHRRMHTGMCDTMRGPLRVVRMCGRFWVGYIFGSVEDCHVWRLCCRRNGDRRWLWHRRRRRLVQQTRQDRQEHSLLLDNFLGVESGQQQRLKLRHVRRRHSTNRISDVFCCVFSQLESQQCEVVAKLLSTQPVAVLVLVVFDRLGARELPDGVGRHSQLHFKPIEMRVQMLPQHLTHAFGPDYSRQDGISRQCSRQRAGALSLQNNNKRIR
mmetsp:Transcript_46855/g.75505  ORF Transcript_46855/g.75505 Transcript_46855/m.75505 type:complete len:232 (-) Transcript_46855:707-1402(-)